VHLPLTTVFRCLKTTRRCLTGTQYQYVGFSSDVIKLHVAVHTTQNHPSLLRRAPNTFFPGRNKIPRCSASGSGSKVNRFVHLSTRNISSKSMHAFLSNRAHRQTYRQTKTNAGMWAKTLSEVNNMRIGLPVRHRINQTAHSTEKMLHDCQLLAQYWALKPKVSIIL